VEVVELGQVLAEPFERWFEEGRDELAVPVAG